MSASYTIEKFSNGMHYITIDRELAESFIKEGHKRVLCRVNNEVVFHGAIMPKKDKSYFINIGLTICKKLKVVEGATVQVELVIDHSKYQFEMPEEFEEVLQSDDEANLIFQSLTDGNKRALIYLVTQVKSSDKRIDRALKIAQKIKYGITSARIILK